VSIMESMLTKVHKEFEVNLLMDSHNCWMETIPFLDVEHVTASYWDAILCEWWCANDFPCLVLDERESAVQRVVQGDSASSAHFVDCP